MKTLNFAELDDAPGSERNLIGILNHSAPRSERRGAFGIRWDG
ncbi:MAG: hypothetical protein ACJA16_000550 [Akkermansiaceae bacterium]|jgi:hypothetical protein